MVTFEFPDFEPSVSFPVSEGVLSPQGNLKVDLDAVNVGGLTLTASRLHANNLAAYLNHADMDENGRQVFEKSLKIDAPRNEVRRLAVDLRGMVGPSCGVYALQVQGEGQAYWSENRGWRPSPTLA